MRHIGIIAGIFDHAGAGIVFAQFRAGERERDARAIGQDDLDGIGELARHQSAEGGAGGSRRAASRRPAIAQRPVDLVPRPWSQR